MKVRKGLRTGGRKGSAGGRVEAVMEDSVPGGLLSYPPVAKAGWGERKSREIPEPSRRDSRGASQPCGDCEKGQLFVKECNCGGLMAA